MNWLKELRHLEAWVQREVQAERRLMELLQAHQQQLVGTDLEALQQSAQSLDQAGQDRRGRLLELETLFGRIAEQVGVRPRTLSIGSLVERAGKQGTQLARLRRELLEVHEATRRALLHALAIGRAHGQVLHGAVTQLLGIDPNSEPQQVAGRFVEVRA